MLEYLFANKNVEKVLMYLCLHGKAISAPPQRRCVLGDPGVGFSDTKHITTFCLYILFFKQLCTRFTPAEILSINLGIFHIKIELNG